MALRYSIGIARLLIALTGVVALVGRFVYGLSFRTFVSVDFFGYLTIQSNMAAVVVTAIAGIHALRGRPESRLLSTARACIACFLMVAGIVFAILVTQAPSAGLRIDVPWSDQILHFVLPVIAFVDWVASPGRTVVSLRALAFVLGYPVVWGIITIVRGQIVGWYPYFFLDPAQAGYPLTLVVYSAAALALFATIALILIGISHITPLGEPQYPGTGYRRAALRARFLRGQVLRRQKGAAKPGLRSPRTARDST